MARGPAPPLPLAQQYGPVLHLIVDALGGDGQGSADVRQGAVRVPLDAGEQWQPEPLGHQAMEDRARVVEIGEGDVAIRVAVLGSQSDAAIDTGL